jgi:hypothetical protein
MHGDDDEPSADPGGPAANLHRRVGYRWRSDHDHAELIVMV